MFEDRNWTQRSVFEEPEDVAERLHFFINQKNWISALELTNTMTTLADYVGRLRDLDNVREKLKSAFVEKPTTDQLSATHSTIADNDLDLVKDDPTVTEITPPRPKSFHDSTFCIQNWFERVRRPRGIPRSVTFRESGVYPCVAVVCLYKDATDNIGHAVLVAKWSSDDRALVVDSSGASHGDPKWIGKCMVPPQPFIYMCPKTQIGETCEFWATFYALSAVNCESMAQFIRIVEEPVAVQRKRFSMWIHERGAYDLLRESHLKMDEVENDVR